MYGFPIHENLCKSGVLKSSTLCLPSTGFSLGRLHMGGFPPIWGAQVQGDKELMGGTREEGHRPYGGDLTLIDDIIN